MHKLLRYYSQNRLKIWAIILAIIFVIAVIQVLNNIAKKQNEQNKNKQETTNQVVSSYQKESQSILTKESVPEAYQEDFGEIIDRFFTYCCQHNPQKAYELLAPDSQKVLYQTQKQFEELYYKEKFEGSKDYSFQLWNQSHDNIYVYQIKIFDNMLTTGKKNNEYIEEYVTIVPVEDSFKLNINSYMGRTEYHKKETNDKMTIEVALCDNYMEYQIYTFRIKNNTEETVRLDTRKQTDTTYVVDQNNNQLESFLFENTEEDLRFKPQEAKTIKIKFNVAYRRETKIKSIHFVDITNEAGETSSLEIEL